ncbi:hypothetical protein [Paenibacillus glycinis]|uniref:Uncharacterized protein n=1 Tax=Paenibacillus glycinis TaxID=2697035 RepID=A0ABW9XY85_9BACL|nr:hypothetical protein [Paenibacillus glycinis]NBD27682.1 hypothetical protein [Paenibacillus glycinis]
MTWYAIPSLLTLSLLIAGIQWRWTRQAPAKEKIVCLAMLGIGWTVGVLLYIYPHLPGPSQLVDLLFGRIGSMLITQGEADS